MRHALKFCGSLLCAAVFIVGLFAGGTCVYDAGVHAQTAADDATLTLLSTTDSHGHLLAWDDMTNKPAN